MFSTAFLGVASTATVEDMNFLEQYTDTFSSPDTVESTPITQVDLSKCAVLLTSYRGVGTAAVGSPLTSIRGSFNGNNSVDFSRESTGVGVEYNFSVVEFPKAISLQFFSVSLSGSSATQAISPVNTSGNRVVILSSFSGTAGNSSNFACKVDIATGVSVNQVSVDRGSSDGTATCDFFVVELPA